MREIKFRAKQSYTKEWVYGYYVYDYNSKYHAIYPAEKEFDTGTENEIICHYVDSETLGLFTGYKMIDSDVYFGDLVSNNYKKDKEVIREIVMHEGSIMMKRIKGKSSLPKYIPLHEWCNLNYKVIGNIHK